MSVQQFSNVHVGSGRLVDSIPSRSGQSRVLEFQIPGNGLSKHLIRSIVEQLDGVQRGKSNVSVRQHYDTGNFRVKLRIATTGMSDDQADQRESDVAQTFIDGLRTAALNTLSGQEQPVPAPAETSRSRRSKQRRSGRRSPNLTLVVSGAYS